ncbi:hypothetical protein BD310DRAFT_823605 [Dichomitus squalens]|uniref:C2H2-type domain-containing protein n=1 Tax=Dichomitus squalens TaxID=114155 RepID=A0A4V2K7J3_9APHY|nr:hypothetical protein BD310DRAFT_823605 [Dichomitus squalens]
MLERLRRPDGYSRNLPLARTRGSEYSTSHSHSRSYFYEKADAHVSPETSSESPSPRETRVTLPPLRQPTRSPMQSISFATTTSATSTWAMSPSAYSPSSTRSSSPVSRSRIQPREEYRAKIESEQGAAISPRDPDLDSWVIAQQKALAMIPPRPTPQVIHPRASISPDRHRSRAASPLWHPYPYPAAFTAERHAYRERQDSWSPEPDGWQYLPPLRNLQPSRAASPEFVQGSSSAVFSAPSRSPSPSPSVSSYSTNEASGRTDTDPTDEDDPVKVEPECIKLPPLRTMFPDAAPGWCTHHSWNGSERSSTSSVHRDALNPLSRSAVTLSTSAEYSARWRPRSPFRDDGDGDLPAQVSDLRSSISHETSNSPVTVSTRTQWRTQQGPASTRGRPAPVERIPSVGTAHTAELPVMSPTPKKYRFVTSKPVGTNAELREEELDERRRPVTVSPSGTKRRHPGTSSPSESSVDAPSPPETPEEEEDGPRKRRQGQGQLPYEGSFPAEPGSNARLVRSPRGAIVPAYHYDTERALKCAFPQCGAVLTGKKSETASHMRSHFLQAVEETLECPWPVEGEDGQKACCGMAFKDSANFGRHVSSKHIKAEEYQCNRCGRPFARRDAALRHMKTLCRVDGSGPKRKNEKRPKTKTEEFEEGEYREATTLQWLAC